MYVTNYEQMWKYMVKFFNKFQGRVRKIARVNLTYVAKPFSFFKFIMIHWSLLGSTCVYFLYFIYLRWCSLNSRQLAINFNNNLLNFNKLYKKIALVLEADNGARITGVSNYYISKHTNYLKLWQMFRIWNFLKL